VFCLFQVIVNEVLALVGFQLFVVMVSVSGTLPVFLMYIVCVDVLPWLIVPKFRVVFVLVQALSEYMPKFTDIIVFFGDWFWAAAVVVNARSISVIVSAIIAVFGSF
jgi:hypothetical protein